MSSWLVILLHEIDNRSKFRIRRDESERVFSSPIYASLSSRPFENTFPPTRQLALASNRPQKQSQEMSSAAARSDQDQSPRAGGARRGPRADEAEEEAEEGVGGTRRGTRKNRVKINRDRDDIPAVRDETGEKVKEMFEHFLEELVAFPFFPSRWGDSLEFEAASLFTRLGQCSRL